MRKTFDIASFASKHSTNIAKVKYQLGTDFDTPAQRIINQFFSDIGEDRVFAGAHDKWEMLIAHESGNEYTPVPKHILRRWLTY